MLYSYTLFLRVIGYLAIAAVIILLVVALINSELFVNLPYIVAGVLASLICLSRAKLVEVVSENAENTYELITLVKNLSNQGYVVKDTTQTEIRPKVREMYETPKAREARIAREEEANSKQLNELLAKLEEKKLKS